jgi:hypothetical protein
VSGWALACFATMAIALVAMAAAQMALAWQITRIARETLETTQQLRRDFRPLVDKLHKIADDASRAAALAVVQVERVDAMMSAAALRVDETLAIVQDAIITPVRHGAAIVAGVRAAFAAFRGGADRPRRSREDEDALFIG